MSTENSERKQQNKYAREVLSGSEVTLSHRSSTPQPNPGGGLAMPLLSDSRGIYVAAAIALFIIGLGVYVVAGFGPASVIFFLLSLVLMAGWFVF
jgi:hypothetical protein